MKFSLISPLLIVTAAALPGTASYCPPQPATTEQQKVIFKEFLKSYYEDKILHESYDKFFAHDFIQHSPTPIGNGRKNATDWLESYWKCLDFKVMRSVFEDGLGVAHIWEPRNYKYHTMAVWYRMEGTCIVEHWDVMQDFPKDAKNPLAMLNGDKQLPESKAVGCGLVCYQMIDSINSEANLCAGLDIN